MLFYIATVSTFKHVRRQNKPEVCTCRQWGELVYMYMIIFISMMNVFKCLKYYYAFCLFFTVWDCTVPELQDSPAKKNINLTFLNTCGEFN